jgi:uncharacterized membrane protein YkvA (DUF1232 family)
MNQSPQTQSPKTPANPGMVADLLRQLRLVWRLYFDARVPMWVKLIPTAALAYIIWPIDLVPELAFYIVGTLDDLGIVALSVATFINLCPPDVVEEHRQAILGETGWRVVPPDKPAPAAPKVIDAPYTVEPDKQRDSKS